MRGIQINNYFNNHITLDGKKINNEQQAVPHSARPKPLTSHLVPSSNPPKHSENTTKKSPSKPHQQTSGHKRRANCMGEAKKTGSTKRSISVQKQRNVVSAKKRDEGIIEQDERQEEQPLSQMSHKRIKNSSSRGGLGKRSKSTIIKTGQQQHQIREMRELPKKQSKKLNSHPTNESVKGKPKRKKSARTIESSKEYKPNNTTRLSRRQFLPIASKEIPKKEKMTIRMDKTERITDKRSARTQVSRSFANTHRSSKPASARLGKTKRNKLFQELKEKYENQAILEGDMSRGEDVDRDFLSVMNSLEKVLTSVGSKQKLRKDLALINDRLKEFKLNSDSEQEEEELMRPTAEKKERGDVSREEQLPSSIGKQDATLKDSPDFNVKQDIQYEERVPKQAKEQESDSEDDQIYMRLVGEEVKNPLIGKRHHAFFQEQEDDVDEEAQERKRQIDILKQFKQQSALMMQKAGLEQSTPLKSQQSELSPPFDLKKEPRSISIEENSSRVSGGSSEDPTLNHNWEDKYPLLPPKSPKFDQSQLFGAITLKEQFLSNKHDKMSELVKTMFEKQLVSPRSFESQMKSLKQKYQQENYKLESFKKQAEQLSSMLSEIKKDKEEIQGIDELIRNEKWEEAQALVRPQKWQVSEVKAIPEQKEEEEREERKAEFSKWEQEQGWERVNIPHSQIENNEFVDEEDLGKGRRVVEGRVDIDDECGGTEESEEISQQGRVIQEIRKSAEDEECIYYQGEDEDKSPQSNSEGLIRLMQVDGPEGMSQPLDGVQQEEVIRIDSDEVSHVQKGPVVIQQNTSLMSMGSGTAERAGFVTNLYFIKEYCIAICEFVRDNEDLKAAFKHNVSTPLEFDIPALLKSLSLDENTEFLYSKRLGNEAITEAVFRGFNDQYESLKCNNALLQHGERYQFEREQQLIFIRMIYDVLNESLNYERPGSLSGKALPWRETAKHLKNLKQLSRPAENLQAYDLMFGVAIARIIQWGSCLCGFLPDTVELENTEIDESYVNHIRETRMAFLLQKMMAEEESVMTNFEMQETEVQYALGHLVYSELIEEALTEIDLIEHSAQPS